MVNHVALVIGGGIAGPAVALLLKKAGYQPTVFEASEAVSDIGGGLQVAPNGMQVLRVLGLTEALLRSGVESAEFSFENDLGKVLAIIPNGPSSRYSLPAIQIGRSVLHDTLLRQLERESIPVHYGKQLRSIDMEQNYVRAGFTDGSSAEGAVLIGADGIHSPTRKLLFPDAAPPFYTGLITLGGFASAPALAARNSKHQMRCHMIFGRNGFFGYGYCQQASPEAVMWWSHQQRPQEPSRGELHATDWHALRDQLIEHYRDWAEPVLTILHNTKRVLWGPVHDVPDLKIWFRNRAVLIGDAAHAISPHAGQGASLALEDAISLAKQLRDRRDHTDAFKSYQNEREERVKKISSEARKRGEAKYSLSPGQAKIRNFMLASFLRLRGGRIFDEAYRFPATWD